MNFVTWIKSPQFDLPVLEDREICGDIFQGKNASYQTANKIGDSWTFTFSVCLYIRT